MDQLCPRILSDILTLASIERPHWDERIMALSGPVNVVGPAGAQDGRALQIIDPVLTQLARQYRPHGYIYNEVCPTINVQTLSGQYPVFDKAYWFSNDLDNRITDREGVAEIDLKWSTEGYLCIDYGEAISITPRERAQANAALRLEESKVQYLMTRMAQAREVRLATKLKAISNGGALTTAVPATTAFATSTAVEADWKTCKMAVYNLTGITPNVAVIPYAKAYDLATNATLRDLWKYIVNNDSYVRLGADSNGEDIFLPRWFHGTRLLIPKGTLVNSAREGAAASLADAWGSSVRFLYVDPQAGWGIPSTCYQFQAPVLTGQGTAGSGPLVDRWRQPNPVKDMIRAVECIDERVVAPETGVELTGV